MVVASFLFFLGVFVVIGLSSVRQSKPTKQDYYLASSTVHPALVGLSAVATNNSGYMFIGVIGYTYATGLASIWIMFGWILGDFLASVFVHQRLRKATQHCDEVSYAGVLSNWYGGKHDSLQRLIGIVSLVFLLAYASAQLVAGSKALQVLFGWPSWGGAVMGATLVLAYCWAGGIRASIWTDAAQSLVMIVAMGMLLVVATTSLGGVSESVALMSAVDGFLDWFPKDLVLPGLAGGVVFAVSWLFAGMSVIGQPHIMARFMALDDQRSMLRARAWYYLWFIAFYTMATGVGMLSRVYLGDTAAFDAELALPTMAQQLFPPVLVGVVLAGIFAATLSTADSLILSCSAAITHDVLPQNIENTREIKLVTALVCGLALAWALLNQESVFSLVILAWSGLASAFAPLLLVLCLGRRPGQTLSIIAVVVGLGVSLLWRFAGLHGLVYEGMPAMIFGVIVLLLGERLKRS